MTDSERAISQNPEQGAEAASAGTRAGRATRSGGGLLRYLPLALVLLAFVGFMLYMQRPADTSEVFDKSVTLQDAMERSRASGKPVFALVTADWCPPCQRYKRGALSDAEVARILQNDAVTLYIDADQDKETLQRLARMGAFGQGGQIALPTTILLNDEKVLRQAEGALSASRVLALLEEPGS